MKKIALSFLTAMGIAVAFADEPFAAVKAIVGRLAGGYSAELAAVESGADATAAAAAMAKFEFALDAGLGQSAKVGPGTDGKIRITAANAAGASFGLGQYLRNDAKVHISWCGNRVTDYASWPLPASEKTYTPSAQLRMAYNYCTISYTMAFWNRRQWREELDRLALNGFNGALVMHGLGKVWKDTLTDMGYTADEIQKFIPDAATWAWWNMGNIEGIGGPVSDAQLEQDAETAKWMYAAMKDLGIEPLLQAFVGLVPSTSARAMAAKYPSNSNGSHYTLLGQGAYQGLTRPWVLHGANVASGATGDDYSLPAFDAFAAAWYAHLAEVYDFETAGDPLYLGGDLFHEGGSTSGVDVTRYAKKIQSVQQQYYPGVKWILQYWGTNPSQAFVNDLAANLTIIECLDLNMHTSGAYSSPWKNSSGVKFPWLWCEVMNFGGNTGMYGGVTRYRNLTKIGVSDSAFLGWGLLSEGLETNPMVYDIMMEQMHQPSNDAMDDSEFATFMDNYLVRRYGQKDANVRAAVQKLAETVLNTKRSQQGVLESVLCANPNKCPVTQVSSWGPSGAIEYDRTELYSVAEAYLEAARSASYKDLEVFKYDFAELFLQLISDRAREINGLTLTSKSARNEFRKLIDLAERLLASSERWRLDWHEDRTAGAADETAAVRGYRRMVTTWVEHNNRGSGSLPEYAHRAYAGLIKDYYGKRWNLFFDKTEGSISESDYTAAINTLDSTFPTAKLTATAAGDLVTIGEEIMETLIPPAYSWTGAGNDGNWATAANWSFKEQATAYENGYDVTLPVDGSTITASAPVTTGAITLGSASQNLAGLSATKTYNTAFIPATAGSIGWTGVTLSDLLNGRYTGVMGGGWMGSYKNLACVGYFPTLSADGQTVTVQFHGFSESYTRCVAVEFAIVDGEVQAKAVWAKNASGNVCGLKNFKSTDSSANGSPSVATSDETAGYGLKAISLYPSTTLTLAGSITVGGALTIQAQEAVSFTGTEPTTLPEVVFANGGSLSAANVTTIESVSVETSGGILELADSQDLEIGSVSASSGSYLIIKGQDEYLESGHIRLPREALSHTRYMGPSGALQELVTATDGSVKTKLADQSVAGYVTTTYAETGWTGMTLADLKSCELTGNLQGGWMGTRSPSAHGYYLTENGDGTISVQMQAQDVSDGSTWLKSVKLTFKEEGGSIYVKSEWAHNKITSTIPEDITGYTYSPNIPSDSTGYGIYGLTVKAAVASVPAIKANYSSIDDAVTAAKAQTDKNVSVIADTTYGTSRGLTGGVILTIEPGVTLTSTTGDGTDWGGTSEVVVKGDLDLAKTRWTFSSNNTLTLYTGATVKGTGDGKNGACAVEIHGNEHTVAVHKGDGETAVVTSTIGLSDSVIFDVDAEAKLEIGNTSGGNNGAAARTIKKSGAGELAIVGSVYANATVILNAGTLTRKLAPEETFTMTVNGGTPNVVSTDEDYEIVDTAEGAVHTYTSTAIPWVFYVTPPGATTDAAAGGFKFRTLDEALAKRTEWGSTAKIWVIRGVHTTLPDGYELDDGSAGSEVIVPVPKLYFPAGVTDWTSSTKVATTKGGTATEAVKAGDVIRFANGSAMPSDSGNLYIANNVATKEMIVTDNTTLRLGSESSSKINLRDGWKVTIDEGSSLILRGWGNGNTAPTHLEGIVTLDGEGIVTIDASDAPTAVWNTVKGTATITIPSGVTVTVTGSIENPIAGAGTIKIAGEQQLKFVADATVKVIYENAQADGYFMNTATVQNPDGTVTRTYGPVEAADIQAFDTSWTYYYTGATADWNTIGNWSKDESKTLVPLTGTKLPATTGSNMWEPILVNGNLMTVEPDEAGYKHVAVSSLEGWGFRIGAVNGAAVDITSMVKMQCDSGCLTTIRVDATSKVTIGEVTRNNGTDAYYYIAAEDGLVLPRTMENNGKYYLTGNGSVKYNGNFDSGTHTFKHAEIEIGTGDYKAYKTKKLISLKSGATNTATFTIDEGAVVDSTSAEGVTLTKKDTAIAAEDAVGTYRLRNADDGIYLDYVAKSETRPLLVWNTTIFDWTASAKAKIEGTSFEVQPTADDTVVFDTNFTTLGEHVFYIRNTDKVASTKCRKLIVRDGVTLHLGYSDSTCNIPNDFTITLEGSAKLVLSRWNSTGTGTCALGSNVTINGGSVEIDSTRATALTVGDIYGTTTLTIPANYTVTAQGDVGVTLTGAGTLKAANLGTIQADAGWTGTVDVSAVAVRGINAMAGTRTTVNDDGSKTIEILEIPNELYMNAGQNLSAGMFTNALGTTVAYATFNTWPRKPLIVLNDNYGIHYFGDTTGYNFAVRDTDIYAMITGSTLAFGDSMIEVQSGTLHLITSEGLRNGSGWNPKVLNLGSADIIVGDSAHVAFTGTMPTDDATIVVGNGKTLTLGGNLNNVSFTNIRFNSPNGKLMLSGGIGTIELVGENIIKEVEIDKTMTLKLNGTASLKTTSADLKIATDSTTQFVKATLVGDQYTYALADAAGEVVFNERENVYNFAAPQFAIENAAAHSTVTVTIKNDQGTAVLTQEATVGADGTVDILVGSAEDPQKPGLAIGQEYKYEVAVGGQTFTGNFYTMNLASWFKADASSGVSIVSGGSWDGETAPAVDAVSKTYTLDGESTFNVTEDKGASKLSYIEQKVTFTSAIDVSDLESADLGTNPTGAITIANDGQVNVWYAYIGGEWKALYDTAAPQLNTEYTIRADVDRAANPKTISYVVNGRHLKDKDEHTVWNLADGAALTKVVFKGSGKLAMIEGVVPSTAVAKVGETEYETLEAALEAHPECGPLVTERDGEGAVVTLLTSVLWAPATGIYYITKGAYDIKVVNEKILTWNGKGTIATVSKPTAPVEGFTAPTAKAKPITLDPTWLNAVVPGGKTIKDIQAVLDTQPAKATMTRMEAYVLGIPADEVETAKVIVASEQTPEPNTIRLGFANVTPRAETGVTVKVQVMAAESPTADFKAEGEAITGASATIALPSTKVKYYRLKVKFE